MSRNILILIVILFLSAFFYKSAAADIYQYIDENGVIHFTNVNAGRNHKKVKSETVVRRERGSGTEARIQTADSKQDNVPAMIMEAIHSACNRYGVDPSLVHAIIKVESDFNPYALSRKGAMGLMQLMPHTAVEMNVKNSFNPIENIEGGVKYLRYLLDRYEGNLSLALAAYNAGETSVKRWGTIPPYRETQGYVNKILRLYNGNGKTFTTQYTIYISYAEDGSLVLTDNPSSYEGRKFSRKNSQSF